MHKFFIVGILFVTLVIVVLSVFLAPNDLRDCTNRPATEGSCMAADAIVAVSGGNTKARTAEAIALYKAGWGKYIIFSGAALDTTGPSNAQTMRAQAIAEGVPSQAIILDDLAQTTFQNAQRTADIAREYSLKRIILVTSPYHQRRASLEFKTILGSSVVILNHPAIDEDDWPVYWWATPRGWWLALSEVAKVIYTYGGGSR